MVDNGELLFESFLFHVPEVHQTNQHDLHLEVLIQNE